jgi:hypothetical protein
MGLDLSNGNFQRLSQIGQVAIMYPAGVLGLASMLKRL